MPSTNDFSDVETQLAGATARDIVLSHVYGIRAERATRDVDVAVWEFVRDLLQVKTDVGQFWDSLAPLTCLFNLLITAIVARLGSAIDKRVARNRELQGEFNQFDL